MPVALTCFAALSISSARTNLSNGKAAQFIFTNSDLSLLNCYESRKSVKGSRRTHSPLKKKKKKKGHAVILCHHHDVMKQLCHSRGDIQDNSTPSCVLLLGQ